MQRHYQNPSRRRKFDQPIIETLVDKFHSMHLHHLPAPVHDEESCKAKFKEALRKWTGSTKIPRMRQSYTDVCHLQKDSKDPNECKYIIKVFKQDDYKNPALFRHETRILKDIQQKKLNIIPHLYSSFACGRYGLVVMDKWDGDILELIFAHKYATPEHLQKLYGMAQHTLEHLHTAGWVHGNITFHNIIFQMQSEGFRLGLVNWSHAKALSPHHDERDQLLIKRDLNDIDIMFMEITQMIDAMKHHEALPDNLPEHLLARFEKKH